MSYLIASVAVLTTTSLFGAYIMYMMVDYLTDVWGLTFTHASGILNVFWGASLMLPLLLQLLADSLIGNYCFIALSHLAYTAGIGLLALSAPPTAASLTGTCKEYKPECIGNVQKILFYTSLPLIAIGMSSHIAPTMVLFLDEQDEKQQQQQQGKRPADSVNICASLAMFLVPVAGFVAILFVKPWDIRFWVSTASTAAATIIFLSGTCSNKNGGPRGSPLTAFVKVLFASTIKVFRFKGDSSDLYERDEDIEVNDQSNILKHNDGLKCLDKAAMKIQNRTVEEQSWTLCRVTEVEQTKLFVKIIPMILTLIIPGLVMSIAATYFLAQADQMNPNLGHIKLPSLILIVFFELTKWCYENYCKSSSARLGVAVSMVFATLSCIVAAIVEHKRLKVAFREGLVNSDDKVSMSMFWLVPQFFLLGLADGICTFSIRNGLLKRGFPKNMWNSMLLVAKALLGVGTAGGAVSVFVVGKISESGGRRSWFQSKLNSSRLDKYYWTLAGISAVNFVFYCFMDTFYYNPPMGDARDEESDSDDTPRCRPVAMLLTILVALAVLPISVVAMVFSLVWMVLSCICQCCFGCMPNPEVSATVLITELFTGLINITRNVPF